MALRNGNKGAHGGPRPNSGRHPDWLKKKCVSLIDKNQLLDFLVRVANGQESETHVTKKGNEVSMTKSSTSIHDRLRAVEMLMDRGFGKAVQPVGLPEGPTGRFIMICGDPS